MLKKPKKASKHRRLRDAESIGDGCLWQGFPCKKIKKEFPLRDEGYKEGANQDV